MKIGIAGPISTESVKHLIKGKTDSLPRGYPGAPFLGTLINELIKNGHHVSAYTLDGSLSPQLSDPIVATGDNFSIYYCPMRKHSIGFNGIYLGRSLDFFYREIKHLIYAIELDQPDIVHAHWTYEFALAGIYSGRPHLITCHDSPLKILKHIPGYYRLGRLLMAFHVFSKAKFLTAVSPYVKNEISRFAKSEISVVPNPTPRSYVAPFSKKHDTSIMLDEPKIVMIINGWGKLKNPKAAMEAFHILLESKPNATLHMFGADFQPEGLAHQWAKKANIDYNMVFHGPTENTKLLTFLEQSTLLLHPSLEECCPMTLIEAMSIGIPVIGGENSGGVPWVLEDGIAGGLVNVLEPNEIAQKIIQILEDKQLYMDIKDRAIKRIQTIFSQQVVVNSYEKLYRSILNDHD